MIPQTMATLITEETYPIAFACLPVMTFGQAKPQAIIDNYYLVINKHQPTSFMLSKVVGVSNTYLTKKEFEATYEAIDGASIKSHEGFFQVRPK